MKQIIHDAREPDAEVIVEVKPDHIHVRVDVDTQFGIHRLMKLITRHSSRLLRQECAQVWTRLPSLGSELDGLLYGRPRPLSPRSASAPLEVVKQDFENQKNA